MTSTTTTTTGAAPAPVAPGHPGATLPAAAPSRRRSRVLLLLVAAIQAGGMAVSYAAIADGAARSGAIPPALAWLAPLLIDGWVLAGTGLVLMRAREGRREIGAWAGLVTASAATVAANVHHALGTLSWAAIVDRPATAAYATLAPAAIIGATHVVARALTERQTDSPAHMVAPALAPHPTHGATPWVAPEMAPRPALDPAPSATDEPAPSVAPDTSLNAPEDGASVTKRQRTGATSTKARRRPAPQAGRQPVADALASAYGAGTDPETGGPWRARALARAAGVHHKTAGRWLLERAGTSEQAPADPPAGDRPALAAVAPPAAGGAQ